MNKAASNALLKALEEPFGSVIFLLVSHSSGSLFSTIRSRCQKIDFSIPSVSSALSWLKSQPTADHDLELSLGLSENIPLRALALLVGTQLQKHQQLVDQFIQIHTHAISPLQVAKFAAEMPAAQVYEGLFLLLRDILRLQQASDLPIAHLPQRKTLAALADQVPPQRIFNFIDQLLEIKKQLDAKIHLNGLLMWEALFVAWLELRVSPR
jgi:DNA polymerase-3 subunit delta'